MLHSLGYQGNSQQGTLALSYHRGSGKITYRLQLRETSRRRPLSPLSLSLSLSLFWSQNIPGLFARRITLMVTTNIQANHKIRWLISCNLICCCQLSISFFLSSSFSFSYHLPSSTCVLLAIIHPSVHQWPLLIPFCPSRPPPTLPQLFLLSTFFS